MIFCLLVGVVLAQQRTGDKSIGHGEEDAKDATAITVEAVEDSDESERGLFEYFNSEHRARRSPIYRVPHIICCIWTISGITGKKYCIQWGPGGKCRRRG